MLDPQDEYTLARMINADLDQIPNELRFPLLSICANLQSDNARSAHGSDVIEHHAPLRPHEPQVRELLCYEALQEIAARAASNELPLGLASTIKWLHMRGIEGGNGQYRRGMVVLRAARTGKITKTGVEPASIQNAIEKIDGKTSGYPAIESAGLIYFELMKIHPFPDGNGRIGRLAITIEMIRRGLLTYPLFDITRQFDRTQGQLNQLLIEGDRKRWLKYFRPLALSELKHAQRRAHILLKTIVDMRVNLEHVKLTTYIPHFILPYSCSLNGGSFWREDLLLAARILARAKIIQFTKPGGTVFQNRRIMEIFCAV